MQLFGYYVFHFIIYIHFKYYCVCVYTYGVLRGSWLNQGGIPKLILVRFWEVAWAKNFSPPHIYTVLTEMIVPSLVLVYKILNIFKS